LTHRTVTTSHFQDNRPEATKAIETLYQQFCDPNGPLFLRQINPNPYLVFAAAADPNSPSDDMTVRDGGQELC
jgi:hypothetical protein